MNTRFTQRFIAFFAFLLFVVYANARTHTIKQGENIQSIAESYGITIEELKQANKQVRYFVNGVILTIPEATAANDGNATRSAKASESVDIFIGAGGLAT